MIQLLRDYILPSQFAEQSKLLGASSEASSPKSLLLEPPQPPTALVGANNQRNFVGRLIYHDLYPPLPFSPVVLMQGLAFKNRYNMESSWILYQIVSKIFWKYNANKNPTLSCSYIFFLTKNSFFPIISWAKPRVVGGSFQTSDFRLIRL